MVNSEVVGVIPDSSNHKMGGFIGQILGAIFFVFGVF